jgi:hypothetical protein
MSDPAAVPLSFWGQLIGSLVTVLSAILAGGAWLHSQMTATHKEHREEIDETLAKTERELDKVRAEIEKIRLEHRADEIRVGDALEKLREKVSGLATRQDIKEMAELLLRAPPPANVNRTRHSA